MTDKGWAAALKARYGAAAEGLGPMPWNDTLALLLAHRSVRAYRPDPLPPGTVEALAAAAQSAATSSNLQAWSLVAVEDPATKAALAEIAGRQRHMVEAPLLLVFLADLARLRGLGGQRQAPTEGLDFLEMLLVGVIDAALAAQNAVVALESLGLGCVYIGALRNDPPAVAELLGLPDHILPVFGLCVGWPDPERPAEVKPRLPQPLVLHRERYDSALPRVAFDGYDEEMRGFQAQQGMTLSGWTKTVLNRVAGPQSLSGRDRMRAWLAQMGFAMK